ncbi:coat protein [Eupatorium vein clearing virus]|uniref:coat protein n=1 Tax=Eupatorium vein clearing virus TaxID=515444 RepID=UPI000172CAD7|nr:coat protein [Eupatorium vein clearing virus]ACB69772.1 coat protein [Eupatorium vein clearing virus]
MLTDIQKVTNLFFDSWKEGERHEAFTSEIAKIMSLPEEEANLMLRNNSHLRGIFQLDDPQNLFQLTELEEEQSSPVYDSAPEWDEYDDDYILVITNNAHSDDGYNTDDTINVTIPSDTDEEEEEINLGNLRPEIFQDDEASSGVFNESGLSGGPSTSRPQPRPNMGDPMRLKPDTGTQVLNLDCTTSFSGRRALIELWKKEMDIILLTGKIRTAEELIMLVDYKTAGNVNAAIKGYSWNRQFSPADLLEAVRKVLYTVFLGEDHATQEALEVAVRIANAKSIMTNLKLCNICNVDEFFCTFEKYMFRIPIGEHPEWVQMYLRKIPFVGEQAYNQFMANAPETSKPSLAAAHRVVKDLLNQKCLDALQTKKLKKFSTKCCPKLIPQNLEIGCPAPKKWTNRKKKSYRKSSKQRSMTKSYRGKRRKTTYQPRKYFRKKSAKTDKKKNCPKGKSSCKCWICNMEGHYANDCPERNKNSKTVKFLQTLDQMGYEPVEDIFDGEQELFYFDEVEPGETSEEESSEDE